MVFSLYWYILTGRGRCRNAWCKDPICDKWISLPLAWILTALSRFTIPPSNSLLKRIWIEAPISIYRRFFGCPVTLARRYGVEGSSPRLDSSGLGTCIFTLLVFSGICIFTLLDFLFFWRVYFILVVFFGFDLCGPTLLGFLVGCTTSFHGPKSLSGSESKRTCLSTQWQGKLI